MAPDRATASALDASDPLADYRDQFAWPVAADGNPSLYLCGNSLGLMPHTARDGVTRVLDDWAQRGVAGHFDVAQPWVSFHRLAAPGLSRLLGCTRDEVVAMNTLTINLNLLLLSFYRPTAERYRILIEADAFPSDRYAVQSQLALHGYDPDTDLVEWRGDTEGLTAQSLAAALDRDERIALVLLPGVQYLSGEVLPLGELAQLAHARGITFGADLAHAIGNVPLSLHDDGIDFAVFCTYKYLNAGPGAVGGAFVHERHFGVRDGQLHGWWGNDEATRFEMRQHLDPAPGADVWQQSNPPILSLAPLLASLALFDTAGMQAVRQKSLQLTGYLRDLLTHRLGERVRIITPAGRSGAQLSLRVLTSDDRGRDVFAALERQQVVCDWRAPDIIRVAPAPLYNRFADAWDFVERLAIALDAP